MTKPQKFDTYKEFAADYATPKEPILLRLKPARYLAVEGRGEPGRKEFQTAIGALYNVAFTVKMARKFAGRDYTVSKLEGLWWADEPEREFLETPRQEWNWKRMIRTPAFITEREVASAKEKLRAKGKPSEINGVKLESLKEGQCVQVLHVGPYETEPATIARMQEVAAARDLAFHGVHHEIYLSDPRRVASAKLRTILRRPVR